MSKKQTKKEKKAARLSEPATTKKIITPPAPSGFTGMTNWLIVLVLVLPVLFSRATIDPVMATRYIFLSGFVLAFVLVFFVLKKNPVLLSYSRSLKVVLATGLTFGLWSMFTLSSAINIAEGYYQVARHFLVLVLLIAVIITIRHEESQVLKLCKAFILVSLVQSVVGIFQFYELGFTDLPGANEKPYGLMANRNLFGSAQMLMLPFVMYVFYKGSKRWKYAGSVALVAIIISLIISQTRSAWLATLAIIILSLILVTVFSPVNRKKWTITTAAGVIAVALITALLLLADEEGTLSKSVKERAATITSAGDTKSESGANAGERLKIWNRSIAMIKDHPVTGVGPGNWKVAIAPYGGNELVWAEGKFIPDRPHNVYLHVLSETGIPGAILYFSMWIAIAIIACKVIIKPHSEDRRILVILMFAGLTGFAFDSFFSFPAERFEHTVYMTLMAGIIVGCYAAAATTEQDKQQPVNKKWAALFMCIAAINLFLGFRKHSFETHMNLAKAYDKKDRYPEVLSEVEAGKSAFITIDPDNKPLEMYSGLAYKGLKNYSKALEEMNKAKRYNPYSAMIYNNLGTIYTDMKQYDSALVNYQRGLAITPKFDILFKNLATNYFLSGNYAACIETIGKMNIEGDAYFNGMLNDAKKMMEIKK
jgi:O-antigen ligase